VVLRRPTGRSRGTKSAPPSDECDRTGSVCADGWERNNANPALGFGSTGFEVVEAGTADDAMEYIASGERIDALITDIRMPGTIE
jgi:hypothetical protein